MTIEEEKKEIDRMTEEKWEAYEKSCCSTTLGEAYGLEDAMSILDQVNGEPVGKADKWTLKELAYELRKDFKFKYLTVSRDIVLLWKKKPVYLSREWFIEGPIDQFMVINMDFFSVDINLSEYKDADGNIDYSKCIVEVPDDIE